MDDLRYIRKRFRCHNCYTKFSKLVAYSEDRATCDKCGNISFTMSEEDFMRQTRTNLDKEYSMVFEKNKKKEEEKSSQNARKNNHRPQNNQRQPTNTNTNNSRVNFNERARSFHRNDMPQNNSNNNNNYNSNFNMNYQNNYNNFYAGNEQNNQRGNRFPNVNNVNFDNFFGFVGSNFMNNNNNNNNNRRNNSNSHHSRVDNNFDNIFFRMSNHPTIITHDFHEDIFDPIFNIFGSSFNNIFINNFSSNFRSSFVNNDFATFLEERLRQNQNNNKPPASKEAINKLKKFKMSEKYCKKNDKGVLEQPTCCICISDIKKNEETLLLPCGHMFHSECVVNWLNQNNTCPVCRFELPTR